MRYAPIKIITNSPELATVNSSIVPLDQVYGFSVSVKYSSLGGGFLTLRASNSLVMDNEKNIISPGTWTVLDGSSVNVFGTGTFTYNVQYSYYLYLMLVYERSGAQVPSALINAWATTKGF